MPSCIIEDVTDDKENQEADVRKKLHEQEPEPFPPAAPDASPEAVRSQEGEASYTDAAASEAAETSSTRAEAPVSPEVGRKLPNSWL